MKRVGGLFSEAFAPANLYAAYMEARRCKRGKRACLQFERRLAANLDALHAELHAGRYAPQPLYSFEILDPKSRVIQAPAFRDLVVQHAIYRVIYPVFDRSFIQQSYACRTGFGSHAASDYAQGALRACGKRQYTLHLDVRKFFYSIDVDTLRGLIERRIKDRQLVAVMMLFAGAQGGVGIPIGNLLSQLYANIYLNPADHYIKRELRVARYARYMDDMLIACVSLDDARTAARAVERFLADRLKLSLSKAAIRRVDGGVNFVGYRTWRSRRFVRKHAMYRFSRAVRACARESIVSFLGHARRTSSLRWMLERVRSYCYEVYRSLPASYRSILDAPPGGLRP